MVLTLDVVAKEGAQRAGDANRERLKDINRYVGDIVIDISLMLRRGAVYLTKALTVTNNIATLPKDVSAVLKVYDGTSTFFESVDNDTWRIRKQQGSAIPTVRIDELAANWTLELLNYGGTGTINIDYLVAKESPTILPDYYKRLIVMGALSLYHLDRSSIDKYREYESKYQEMKNEFKEHQVYSTDIDRGMKPQPQIEFEDPHKSFIANSSNDFFSPGGFF